jgi:signal transduction histidine kinase
LRQRSHRPSGGWRAAALILILGWPAVGSAQPAMRRVLLLYSYEREFAPHYRFAELFRPALSESSAEPIDFLEVSLQAARLSRNGPDESVAADFKSTFAGRPIDLVVPIGGPAAGFAQKFRDQLFPDTPMLFAAADRRFVQTGSLTVNDTAVAVAHDPPQMLETILQLLPETKTVVVIIGASKLEQFWLEETRRGFKRFEDRVAFVWTNELSYGDMMQRCATLPPDSAIFYGMLSLDASGTPQVESRTLTELRARANAPVFGLHSSQFDFGIVGGPLLSVEELSRTTAQVAVRLLRGEKPGTIQPAVLVPGTPVFDWRELRRWRIPEDRLPPGSLVQFRQPTFWRRYRVPIVVVAAVAGVQAVLLIGLFIKQRRRRLANAALTGLSRKLIQTHEQERAAVARTLHDDVSQRMMALTMRLQNVGEATAGDDMPRRVDELCDEFAELASDIAAVPDRAFADLELLGLVTAARSYCERVSAQYAVAVALHESGVPDDLRKDIALALFRVLQESVANAVAHADVRQIDVTLCGSDRAIGLEIADHGIGFDVGAALDSCGAGLLAMRERIGLVNGVCAIESRPGAGTRIIARVPLCPAAT